MTKDKMIKALAYKDKVRVYAAITTNTVQEAITRHGLNLMSAMALGRLLTATAMMSHMSKSDNLTLSVLSKGPMGRITAISQKPGMVKGYVENNDFTSYNGEYNSLGELLLPAQLAISKDMGMKEPYTGIIQMDSGEIAQDIAKYYSESEQTPTACALGTYFDKQGRLLASGGYIIQVLPDTDEWILNELEQRVALSENISNLLYDLESPERLLDFLFSDRDARVLSTEDISFYCGCSREGILEKLITIDKSQLTQIAKEQESIEAVCPYCNNIYTYSAKEVLDLLTEDEE